MRKEYRKQKARARFVKYLRKTWRNKLAAIALIMAGMLGVIVLKEGTALLLFLIIGIPLFFTKQDCFY